MNNALNEHVLLTMPEMMARLRISRRTLYEHIKRGRLPAIKLGARTLFHWPSVEAALLRKQRGVLNIH